MRLVERTDTPPRGKAPRWWQATGVCPPWEDGGRQKDFVKACGFWFDGAESHPRWPRNPGEPTKTWWTDDPERAAKLLDFADAAARATLESMAAHRETQLEASRAADAPLDVPLPEGCVLFPFQRAGVAYALNVFAHDGAGVLLADQMGLGKTPQAVATVNALPDVRTVVVACPKVAMMVWVRHAERWLARPFRVRRMEPGAKWPVPEEGRGLFVVVNYDILHRYAVPPVDMLIVDEAHYLKNPKAKRTKAALGIRARHRMALTGTPVPNRPVELWPLLSWLDPARWNPRTGFLTFAKRYCGATQITTWDGASRWDFSGATNLAELQQKLRSTIMVRRLKEEVLTELPPKVRTVVELDSAGVRELLERERVLFDAWDADGRSNMAAFEELSRVRHEVGLAKVELVVDQIRAQLEERPKVVVFGWHKDVLHAVAAAFGAVAVLVDGDTSAPDRERHAQRFQTDPACRVFIGNMQAAGTAITLTASDYVAFVEEDWTPGTLSQAEDRCHRIGQRASVLVQHFVFADSLDARMVEVVIEKQRVADAALDARHPDAQVVAPPVPRVADVAAGGVRSVRAPVVLDLPLGPERHDESWMPTRDFLLAGRAIFTVSDESGAWRFTYQLRSKARGADDAAPIYFAGLLVGPENTRDYDYVGVLDPHALTVRHTAKSKVAADAPSAQVLRWFLRHVAEHRSLPDGYAVRHARLCGRCGRALTTPESIDLGLGPECARR